MIDKKLIGTDVKINDIAYRDAFTEALNEHYNIDDVLGEHKQGIALGVRTELAHFTMGSDLQKHEAEESLNAILYLSAQNDEWVGIKVSSESEYVKMVAQHGFGILHEHEDNTYLIPTEFLMKYCLNKSD